MIVVHLRVELPDVLATVSGIGEAQRVISEIEKTLKTNGGSKAVLIVDEVRTDGSKWNG